MPQGSTLTRTIRINGLKKMVNHYHNKGTRFKQLRCGFKINFSHINLNRLHNAIIPLAGSNILPKAGFPATFYPENRVIWPENPVVFLTGMTRFQDFGGGFTCKFQAEHDSLFTAKVRRRKGKAFASLRLTVK